MFWKKRLAAIVLLLAYAAPPAGAEPQDELVALELEELMDVQVTSISRSSKKVKDSPAAVFVISQEDIRRSGATAIPELLRMVPGFQVARVNASTWSISSRGFSSPFANKLLVLIDGRVVYNPIFSGTFWDVQDTMLQDVERIEVVRGPGGTLWGANAVNGVINIITKNSSDTKGFLGYAGTGNEQPLSAGVRQGVELADGVTARVYAKGDAFEEAAGLDGVPAYDEWTRIRSGARLDAALDSQSALSLLGDVYSSRQLLPDQTHSGTPLNDMEREGFNLIARYTTALHNGHEYSVQAYIDRFSRNVVGAGADISTFDLDTQYRFNLTDSQTVTVGAGYRRTRDESHGPEQLHFLSPGSDEYDLLSAFIQDEIELGSVTFAAGAKVEHNDFSGFEYQPSARAIWAPAPWWSFWGAVSRAVRTPSRGEDALDIRRPLEGTAFASLRGSSDLDSETLIAYEIGQRTNFTPSLLMDVALFINDYPNLRRTEAAPDGTEIFADGAEGRTRGGELLLEWQLADDKRLIGTYSYIEGSFSGLGLDKQLTMGSGDARNMFELRYQSNLRYGLEFDTTLRYVDALTNSDVPGYTELDARLGYKLTPELTLDLIGTNLLNPSHREHESVAFFGEETEVQRSFFIKLTASF